MCLAKGEKFRISVKKKNWSPARSIKADRSLSSKVHGVECTRVGVLLKWFPLASWDRSEIINTQRWSVYLLFSLPVSFDRTGMNGLGGRDDAVAAGRRTVPLLSSSSIHQPMCCMVYSFPMWVRHCLLSVSGLFPGGHRVAVCRTHVCNSTGLAIDMSISFVNPVY